jgi:hypothetical protein
VWVSFSFLSAFSDTMTNASPPMTLSSLRSTRWTSWYSFLARFFARTAA